MNAASFAAGSTFNRLFETPYGFWTGSLQKPCGVSIDYLKVRTLSNGCSSDINKSDRRHIIYNLHSLAPEVRRDNLELRETLAPSEADNQ